MRIRQVDAFTNRVFGGNPAAVCVLPQPAPDHWMQALALEMNLSETAFAWPEADGYRLRWFTPAIKVDLCKICADTPRHDVLSQFLSQFLSDRAVYHSVRIYAKSLKICRKFSEA